MSVFDRLLNLGRGVVAQATRPSADRAAEAERIARLEEELADAARRPTPSASGSTEGTPLRDLPEEEPAAVTPRKRNL